MLRPFSREIFVSPVENWRKICVLGENGVEMSSKPPKGTSLRETTSFDALFVKIGAVVLAIKQLNCLPGHPVCLLTRRLTPVAPVSPTEPVSPLTPRHPVRPVPPKHTVCYCYENVHTHRASCSHQHHSILLSSSTLHSAEV